MAGALPSRTVAFSIRLLQIEHCHTSGTLDAIARILFCARYLEAYESMDVTLTNPIIENVLQPPEDNA
jgi:hypothetical protein